VDAPTKIYPHVLSYDVKLMHCIPWTAGLLWRDRHKWKDNIKMDFKKMGYEDVNISELAEDS
jgi:hypothetical protein